MIIGYGNYALTFAIASSGAGAAFLTSSTNLVDARTGSVTSMSWATGAQTTASSVTLTVTVADPLDTTAPIGVVGVANCSLPVGTKVVVNGVTQRLVSGARGEMSAWWIPNALNSNSFTIQFFNDVAGSTSAAITAGMTWAIGEIFVGRIITLPSMVTGLMSDVVDPTAFQRSAGGQLWQLMRKPYRQCQASLGPFSTINAMGGTTSTQVSGANPAGVIDIKTLREYLATATVCAVCDAPTSGLGNGTVVNGIRFDQTVMQSNWMVARPSSIGQLSMTSPPLWTWNPSFQEST